MEVVIIKQTDMPLSQADGDAVRRFLFQSIDGCNDRDKKAWRSFWRAVAGAGSGEYFSFSIKRQRHGAFHRLTMLVLSTVFKAQERFEDFRIFRQFVKVGAGFVDYVPDVHGELKAHPKSQSFDECSEEEVRQFFDDALAFLRTGPAQAVLWPNLSHEVAERGLENLLLQFERPMS